MDSVVFMVSNQQPSNEVSKMNILVPCRPFIKWGLLSKIDFNVLQILYIDVFVAIAR